MPPAIRRSRLAVLLWLVAGLGLTGCSTTTKPIGTGDVSGLRLGAFASDRANSGGNFDIFLWDYDAASFHSLPGIISTAAERHPSLSSDGRFIAYQVDRGGGDNIEVYDRRTATIDKMTEITTGLPENEPAFSGDSRVLCFTQGSSPRRIRLFDGPTRSLIALPGLDTTGTYSDYSPAPNRDASLIAFVSDRNGAPDIFVYDRARKLVLDGPKLRAALVSPADDIDPSFSSNGRFLTFASNRSTSLGGYDVYLLEFVTFPIADTLLSNLTTANSVSDERHPAVNDPGTELVFQSNRAGGQGRLDLWNFDRNANQPPTQPPGYDSPGDDIEVSLKWPN